MFADRNILLITLTILTSIFYSCKSKHAADTPQIIETPEKMDEHVSENIKDVLLYAADHSGKINDTIQLFATPFVDSFYKENNYKNVWSKSEVWDDMADSLFSFIKQSEEYGLFPGDYHVADITSLKHKLSDSIAKTDANLWTQADIIFTDAFMQISRHLKWGRLLPDTISLMHKNYYTSNFFVNKLNAAFKTGQLTNVFTSLEPDHIGYLHLRRGIKSFIDSMDKKRYTYIVYQKKDSMALIKNLQKRLGEEGYLEPQFSMYDSLKLADAIKKFQKKKNIKQDGKISTSLASYLNNNDRETFKKIAINLDRYKQLPDNLPQKYIWVNLPGYYLQVWRSDTIVFESKVIIGKPGTRTPLLTSAITDMVTYPQWTIPNSIIKKDILPAMKRDPGYLARKGFNLVSEKGETIDPYSINWQKYSKGIPFKIVQGSGDDNALGIFKFNFNNPYSVYLHDTNQRYLFKNTQRALSHGCVRVQDWQTLAFFIAANDSIMKKENASINYNSDSIKVWLANKVRKRIIVKNHLSLYIRYFTCQGKKGKIIFYDDVYGEDRILKEKYFANK